ncbi:hypothetical protein FKM82_001017 [Ascaphus truei]
MLRCYINNRTHRDSLFNLTPEEEAVCFRNALGGPRYPPLPSAAFFHCQAQPCSSVTHSTFESAAIWMKRDREEQESLRCRQYCDGASAHARTAQHQDSDLLPLSPRGGTFPPFLHHQHAAISGNPSASCAGQEPVTVRGDTLLKYPLRLYFGLRLGWTNLKDEEFLELYKCLTCNHTLKELWVEGNDISYNAIEQFSDISSFNSTLRHVVLLGNKLEGDDITLLKANPHRNVIVADINDEFGKDFWQDWWHWIFKRCKTCNDEKIVSFLTKVYCGLSLSQGKDIEWLSDWYTEVDTFLQERIKQCTVNTMKRRMEGLQQLFHKQSCQDSQIVDCHGCL